MTSVLHQHGCHVGLIKSTYLKQADLVSSLHIREYAICCRASNNITNYHKFSLRTYRGASSRSSSASNPTRAMSQSALVHPLPLYSQHLAKWSVFCIFRAPMPPTRKISDVTNESGSLNAVKGQMNNT